MIPIKWNSLKVTLLQKKIEPSKKNKNKKTTSIEINLVIIVCIFFQSFSFVCFVNHSKTKNHKKTAHHLQNEDGKDDDLNEPNRSRTASERLAHKKQRKARTAFTDHQLHSMEKCFSRQKYLSVQDRMELANKLGISDTQVKTWFQNRR